MYLTKYNRLFRAGYCIFFTVIIVGVGGNFYGVSLSNVFNYFFIQKKNEIFLLENYKLSIKSNIEKDDYPEKWLKDKEKNSNFLIVPEKNKYVVSKFFNIIYKEAKKIPAPIFSKNVNTIYILKELKPNGLSIGGTYSISEETLYFSSRSKNGFVVNNNFISTIFHHEISSIFMKNYGFKSSLWKSAYKSHFLYKGEENPFYYLVYLQGNADIIDKKELLSRGLLNQYSETGLENDFNTYAEVVFTDPNKMKKLVDQYPIVARKYQVFKEFYLSIDKGFAPVFAKIDG